MTKLFNANNQFIEYMKISLVSDKNQIIANIKTIEKYLMGDSDNDFDIMAKHISHGRVFIAYKIDGDFHFAPSRFIGYANNTLERHKQNLDKHGTITTQQITRILGHSNIYSQELEDAYKTYCFWLGKQPSKNNRSYWCLEDEIPWESGNSHFFEGGRKLVTHMKIERNSKVVAEAKSIFKRNHNNELYCEICGFNFKSAYGEIGKDFIEAHHKIGLATTDGEHKIEPSDFLMACSNCHSMLHRANISINELKSIIKGCSHKK